VFVLQIVVKAKPLGGEVLADDRKPELGARLPTKLLGPGKAQMTRGVGAAARFRQQSVRSYSRR
jgi:hypothetical protein